MIVPKTRDAFAFKKLYADFAQWQEKYQKVQREPTPPPSSKEFGAYEAHLEGVAEGWVDVISRYLSKYPLPPHKNYETISEIYEGMMFIFNTRPKIEVERGNQVLKRIERHIGRLKSYSQKIFADVLAQGFNDTLRTKGNRVNGLIRQYSYIAEMFKGFSETVQERNDRVNEEFQRFFRAEFGRRLKQARKAAKLTQQQLAELVGLKTFNAIAQYERGISDPSLPTLYRISKILNCSADWLLSLP